MTYELSFPARVTRSMTAEQGCVVCGERTDACLFHACLKGICMFCFERQILLCPLPSRTNCPACQVPWMTVFDMYARFCIKFKRPIDREVEARCKKYLIEFCATPDAQKVADVLQCTQFNAWVAKWRSAAVPNVLPEPKEELDLNFIVDTDDEDDAPLMDLVEAPTELAPGLRVFHPIVHNGVWTHMPETDRTAPFMTPQRN